MKTLFIILCIFLLSNAIIGQEKNVYVVGTILNTEKEPVRDAKVFLSTFNKKITLSDKKGNFKLPITKQTKGEIIISHVAYKQQAVALNKKLFRKSVKDTIYITITLKDRELEVLVVGGKQKPKLVYGSEETSVEDFLFHEDKLLLLSYSKSIEKDPLLKLVDQQQNLICEYEAPKGVTSLYTDFENKHYLITKTKIYLITIANKSIRLREVDKKLFNDFTSKIIDTINGHFLYSNFSPYYPAFDILKQPKIEAKSSVLQHIEDEFMMDLYRSEYKYASTKDKLWAFKQENRTGIDKEIWIGAQSFTSSPYYKSLYAPLFVLEDTILVFDHYGDRLHKFNPDFTKFDSIPIHYHKSKKDKRWEQPLIKDKEAQKMYALFKSGGYHYLKNINLLTGQAEYAFKLFYRYSEHVKTKNGYTYYIYRPFESTQRKYLYREKILGKEE